MELETKNRLAELLRAAANQRISEGDFWSRFNQPEFSAKDPVINIAYETAIHYWGNFHARNLLFIRVKPDRYQVQQGKDQLNLIADALERGWPAAKLRAELDEI